MERINYFKSGLEVGKTTKLAPLEITERWWRSKPGMTRTNYYQFYAGVTRALAESSRARDGGCQDKQHSPQGVF